jgi:hypothetical protein
MRLAKPSMVARLSVRFSLARALKENNIVTTHQAVPTLGCMLRKMSRFAGEATLDIDFSRTDLCGFHVAHDGELFCHHTATLWKKGKF